MKGGGNWNIWINSNILRVALLTMSNSTARDDLITKAVKDADLFIDGYGNDGGCVEGPEYWIEAGGQLIQFMELLSSASNGTMSWASNELIHSIGTYIYKVHIDGIYFVDFGDASAKIIPDPTRVLKFGLLFKDDKMKQFASSLYKVSDGGRYEAIVSKAGATNLGPFIDLIEYHSMLKSIPEVAPQPIEAWLPNLQIIVLRSFEGNAKELVFAAKGGNNSNILVTKIQ